MHKSVKKGFFHLSMHKNILGLGSKKSYKIISMSAVRWEGTIFWSNIAGFIEAGTAE
jgi:hypothetical protein